MLCVPLVAVDESGAGALLFRGLRRTSRPTDLPNSVSAPNFSNRSTVRSVLE